MEFAVPGENRAKLKERDKKDRYLDLTRELKQLLNMKMVIIPIILFTNPSARAGYDTRSIFKRSLTGLNSGF